VATGGGTPEDQPELQTSQWTESQDCGKETPEKIVNEQKMIAEQAVKKPRELKADSACAEHRRAPGVKRRDRFEQIRAAEVLGLTAGLAREAASIPASSGATSVALARRIAPGAPTRIRSAVSRHQRPELPRGTAR